MDFTELWNKHEDYWIEDLIPNNQKFWEGTEYFDGGRIFMLSSAVIHEAVELQRETNWKWWKKPTPIDMDKVKKEIIDIMHFANQLAMEVGMTSEEVIDVYNNKLNENINRQRSGY
jgi:hypothetical protein